MSNDTIPFPTPQGDGAPADTKVPDVKDIQGLDAFHSAMQACYQATFQTIAPYKDASPLFGQLYGEVLRYLELATMYMDRVALCAANPDLVKKREDTDASSAS